MRCCTFWYCYIAENATETETTAPTHRTLARWHAASPLLLRLGLSYFYLLSSSKTMRAAVVCMVMALFLAAEVHVEARRRKKSPAAAASTFVEDDDLNVESEASLYNVNDPAADHAGVGMQRANDDDLDGALEAFRAQLKFDQHKANAHNNLGVTLLRMGNARDAETARRLYYQALTNFQSSLQQGNGGAQDNIDAIHQNCKIRYNTNCGEAFAAFTGGVGVFSSDDDEDDWEDSDEDDWGDAQDDWEDDAGASDDDGDWEDDDGGDDDDWADEADDAFDEDE